MKHKGVPPMFIRILTLAVCQITIIAVALFIYDSGWSHLTFDMKMILPVIGGVAFLMTGMLVIVSEETIIHINNERHAENRRQSIRHPLK